MQAANGYEGLPDGVLVADARGIVAGLNVVGARILRCPVQAVLGRDFRDVLPLADAAGRNWWRRTDPYGGLPTRTGQPERWLALPDGRGLYVTARYVRASHLGPLSALVVCFRDASIRERAERNGADLVSTVAHELRSPLTSVKGFTATLLAKWDRFTDEQRRLMLETVNADADRVTRLITDLLDVSRIDAGRLELHRRPIDVTAAVQRAVAGRVAAGDAPNRFAVGVEGELPETWLDSDKLDQVLANLLENAVTHGAGTVRVTVAPWHGDAGSGRAAGVIVSVADEGTGVPPELTGVVFHRFWRNGKRGGTGLGLYMVKGLVEAHGGFVSLGRVPGGGADFRVHLPSGVPDLTRLPGRDTGGASGREARTV